MKEFPGLVKLHKQHGADKVACVSVSFDAFGDFDLKKDGAEILAFLQKQNAEFNNIVAADGEATMKWLGVTGYPAVVIYDREGKMVAQLEGEDAHYDAVGKLVDQLLASEPAPEKEASEPTPEQESGK
ncbi:MAG: TlpA family protein disulfide reductase [Planctomycetales bacterium]